MYAIRSYYDIGMNTGYDVAGVMAVDNLKIWDHVVSEDPEWLTAVEGQENAMQIDEAAPPVYWSKCEDETNISSPEIRNNFV